MEYLVIGSDGQEYGPANVVTLKQWVADNRVGADTNLREFQTGKVVQARAVPFLFAPTVVTPTIAPPPVGVPGNDYRNPPSAYPKGVFAPQAKAYPGNSDIIWAIVRSVLALVLFFVFNGIGLIVAVYGLAAAIRAQQAGHRFGVVAIAISGVTLIILGIGWFLRLSPHSV